MPSAVGTTHHIKIKDKFYLLGNYSYTRGEVPVASVPGVGQPIDLNPIKKWRQKSWVGGMGQRDWQDEFMYDEGFVDTWSHPRRMQCLPRVQKHTTLSPSGASGWKDERNLAGMQFEVRALDENANPELYFIHNGPSASDGEVWRLVGTTVTRTAVSSAFTGGLDPRSIGNAWKNQPFTLIVGTTNGKLYKFAKGTNTPTAAAVKDFGGSGNQVRVQQNFNNADYYGLGFGDKGGELHRASGTAPSYVRFFDSNQHAIVSACVWNSRMWILTIVKNRWTRLFVTDGNVTNLAYEWGGKFIGDAVWPHGGRLYISGGQYAFDNAESIGQVWAYNGASMDLLGEFDGGGLADTARYTSGVDRGVDSLHSFGRFLAASSPNYTMMDGTDRRGLYFYDPQEDAWHYGAYIDPDDITATSGARKSITAMQEYNGRLYLGTQDARGKLFFIRNDDTGFTKSMYRSSIFDAGVPGEDKLFTAIRLLIQTSFNSRIDLEYSTDRGDTWTTAGLMAHTNGNIRTVEFVLGSGQGILAKSIQLRLTLWPGDASGVAPLSVGATTPKVYWHEVEYDVAPDKLYFWNFTVLAAPFLRQPDGDRDSRTGEDIANEIKAIDEERKLFDFVDVDGVTYSNCRIRSALLRRSLIANEDLDGLYGEYALTIEQVR